jgi:hypothetical protein
MSFLLIAQSPPGTFAIEQCQILHPTRNAPPDHPAVPDNRIILAHKRDENGLCITSRPIRNLTLFRGAQIDVMSSFPGGCTMDLAGLVGIVAYVM